MQTTLAETQTALATCTSNLSGVEAQLASATADADGDCVRDLDDASLCDDRPGAHARAYGGQLYDAPLIGRPVPLRGSRWFSSHASTELHRFLVDDIHRSP